MEFPTEESTLRLVVLPVPVPARDQDVELSSDACLNDRRQVEGERPEVDEILDLVG